MECPSVTFSKRSTASCRLVSACAPVGHGVHGPFGGRGQKLRGVHGHGGGMRWLRSAWKPERPCCLRARAWKGWNHESPHA
eukprot:15449460-Alexandrium_andersonii.AAC.1